MLMNDECFYLSIGLTLEVDIIRYRFPAIKLNVTYVAVMFPQACLRRGPRGAGPAGLWGGGWSQVRRWPTLHIFSKHKQAPDVIGVFTEVITQLYRREYWFDRVSRVRILMKVCGVCWAIGGHSAARYLRRRAVVLWLELLFIRVDDVIHYHVSTATALGLARDR